MNLFLFGWFWIVFLITARCTENSEDKEAIKERITEFFSQLGKPGMKGDAYTAFYTPNALLSIAGKTVGSRHL